jgi:hypothetical protein
MLNKEIIRSWMRTVVSWLSSTLFASTPKPTAEPKPEYVPRHALPVMPVGWATHTVMLKAIPQAPTPLPRRPAHHASMKAVISTISKNDVQLPFLIPTIALSR